jgi:hypothetical protein
MTLQEARDMTQEIANRYCAYDPSGTGSSIECEALERVLSACPRDEMEEALLECRRGLRTMTVAERMDLAASAFPDDPSGDYARMLMRTLCFTSATGDHGVLAIRNSLRKEGQTDG